MIFWFIITRLAWLFYKIVFQVKVEGVENIPKTGGALICPNHISNFDGPLVVTMVTRRTNIMTKAEAFKPVIGFFMKQLGCYPIRRDKKDFGTLKKSATLLKKGNLVVLFPEGTRNGLAKGFKLRNGAAFLCLASKTPLVPVGISGKYKPFGKLKIKFGKPITFEEFSYIENDKEKYEKINEKILSNIKNQLTN